MAFVLMYTLIVFCSYVQDSYAPFLWDAEEEEDEGVEKKERYEEVLEPQTSGMVFFTGPYPITAVS